MNKIIKNLVSIVRRLISETIKSSNSETAFEQNLLTLSFYCFLSYSFIVSFIVSFGASVFAIQNFLFYSVYYLVLVTFLAFLSKNEKRCEVNYTKFGDIQQVAWAESTPTICDNAFEGIRSNIEGAGYQCQEGTQFKKAEEKKGEDNKPLETASANTDK